MEKGILKSAFSSDSSSTPSGYLLNEVSNYSFSNDNNCVYLENYLVKKLKKNDPITKFKSLRIIKHLCENGNPSFKVLIQRHANQIRYCQSYKGTYDPIYGDALSEMVREEAIHCLKSVFSTGNRNDGSLQINNGGSMKIIGGDRMVSGSKATFGHKDCSDNTHDSASGGSSYKNRIRGFGNTTNTGSKCGQTDRSGIYDVGNSIIYNARIGQYNQVVEDISDLVLKIIPNKLVNGISNYYHSYANSNSSMHGRSSSSFTGKREIHSLSNNACGGGVPFPGNAMINKEYGSSVGSWNSSKFVMNGSSERVHNVSEKQDSSNRFPKPESKSETAISEAILCEKSSSLESLFVDNYCLVTGLIVAPSNEQLQDNIKEILKLDIPLVISLLCEKLRHYYQNYCRDEGDCGENKSSEGFREYENTAEDSGDKAAHSMSPVNEKLRNSKIVYRILCLLLSLLEFNETTRNHLIRYSRSNKDLAQLINSVSDCSLQCKKKAKLVTSIISTSNNTDSVNLLGIASDSKNHAEITNNLIEIDSLSKNMSGGENSCGSKTENEQEINKLFKNLSIRNRKVDSLSADCSGDGLLGSKPELQSKTVTEVNNASSLIDLDF